MADTDNLPAPGWSLPALSAAFAPQAPQAPAAPVVDPRAAALAQFPQDPYWANAQALARRGFSNIGQGNVMAGVGNLAGSAEQTGAGVVMHALHPAAAAAVGLGHFLGGLFGGGAGAPAPAAATSEKSDKGGSAPAKEKAEQPSPYGDAPGPISAIMRGMTNNQAMQFLGQAPHRTPADQMMSTLAGLSMANYMKNMQAAGDNQEKQAKAQSSLLDDFMHAHAAVGGSMLSTIQAQQLAGAGNAGL